MNNAESSGPIPRGIYGIMGTWDSPNTGKGTIILKFLRATTDPFPSNRSMNLMRIHGDRAHTLAKLLRAVLLPNRDARKSISQNCGQGSTLTVTR
jgi:hypothetical protein